MKRICSLLPRGSIAGLRLKSLWDEYEARITPESKIVKDLDLFELALQGVEYERRKLPRSCRREGR
jgi:putative hydrolase of HD superfamily